MTEIPNTINDFYRMSLMLSTNTKDIRAQAYEEMALGALLKLDHGTVKQISDEIASTPPHFRPVDFILGDVLGNLVHSGKIQKTNSQYSITETERQRLNLLLEERLYEIVSIEKNWLSEMRERALLPIDLLPSDRETIIQDLRGVCLRLYEIRGDEYVDFYTKKKKSLEINLDKSTIRDNLPKNRPDYLLKIEEDIIPRFFIGTDARQISYIGRFAQIYVRLCALNVETKGQQILEEKLDGVEVFLDTNIIFALFGLCQGGPLEVKTATERLIGINRTLGVEQIVSSLTIEEFLCCKNAAKAGGLGPMVPDTLDELGEDIYPEDSFAYAFWREMHAKGLQNEKPSVLSNLWTKFLNRFDLISDKLQSKYAIHVLRVNYRQLLENPDLPWLMHEITKVKPEKREAAATHDAMNFILVEERRKTLREQPPLTGLLPSNVWMISYDKSLHKFGDAAKTQLGSDISYLIYGASWVEMVSPLIPLDAELPFDVADIIGVLSKHSFLFLGKEISTEQLSLVFQSVPPSGENFSLMLKMLGNEHYREALEKEEKEHSLTRGSVNVVIRQYLAEIKAEQQVSRREQEALRKNGDNEWNHTEEVNKTLEATLNNAQKLLEEKDKQLISITEKMRQLEEAERTRIETEGARTTQRRKAVKRVVLFLSYLMLIGIPSYFLMSKGLHVAVILTAIAGLASIILQFRKGVLAKLLSIGALLCAVCISAGYLLFADHLWEWIGSAILGILLFIVDRTNLHEKIGSIST